MVVYYNTHNLPQQDYRIVSETTRNGRWTSNKLMEHAMYPWKNVQPDREVSFYELEGEDGDIYYVDAQVLFMAMMHRSISIINGRVTYNTIQYNPNIYFD